MMSSLGSMVCMLILAVVFDLQDLGPHNINGHGCLSCHNSRFVDSSNVTGSLLWGNFSEASYTATAGTTLTLDFDSTNEDPSFHSAVCLGCHDGGIASAASASGGTSAHNHPVNVPYVLGANGHWPGSVTGNGVTFFADHFDAVYGRPIRLYVLRGIPYIECTSCHDPHHYSRAVMTINGQTVRKPTTHFVRGWYDPENTHSNSASQFCRSCHYDLSNEADGISAPTS